MKTYCIFAKPGDSAATSAVFVPDGFSWAGFVFTGLWALWNRMWIVAALVIAVMLLAGLLSPELQFAVSLGLSLVLGVFASELRHWSLARRGFVEIGTSHGDNAEEAELRFYAQRNPRALRIPKLAQVTAMDHEPLGLFGAKS